MADRNYNNQNPYGSGQGGSQGYRPVAPAGAHASYGFEQRPGAAPRAARSFDMPEGGSSFGAHGSDGLKRVKKKRHKGMKIALIIFGILLAGIVGVGVALAVWVGSLNASMGFENEEEHMKLIEALEPPAPTTNESNAFYMLILGSDAREGDTASRSDVTMLVRIDSETSTVDLVSIPRDTMVTIPGQGTQKINAAYSFGGAAGAVQTVGEFAGVPITHYAEVHFQELERVVDMLGGVWVNVPESFDAGNGGMSFSAGEQRLTGAQALAFARERYNVSGGDFGRAQAQRLIVQAIVQQVLSASPAQLPGIVGNLATCVSTDLSVGDLVAMAQQFQAAGGAPTIYSAACPSYSFTQDGVSYVGTMFDEWRTMMCLVDAGLDPNDAAAEVPLAQQNDLKLGAATNSPAPRSYETLVENAGLTTQDVASAQ